MVIGILSDSHDNLVNLKTALEFLETHKISTLIHCGDICTFETIKYMSKHFAGDIYIVPGNADLDTKDEEKRCASLKNVEFFPKVGAVTLNKIKIAFTHEPWLAKKLAEGNRYDLILYGHTHLPWEETVHNSILLNPGNIAGIRTMPTFAVYDLNKKKAALINIRELQKK